MKFNIGDLVALTNIVSSVDESSTSNKDDALEREGQIGRITDIERGSDYPFSVHFTTPDSAGSFYNVFAETELKLVFSL